MTGGMFRVLCIAVDKLVEPAHRAIGGFVLVEECKIRRFELVKKILPGDWGKGFVLGTEIESQQAGSLLRAGSLHACGPAAARLRPTPNGVVIGRDLGV